MLLRAHLDRSPFVAILRGVTPPEAAAIAVALRDAGLRIAEVPLNVPSALESIKAMVDAVGETMLVGAGTVLAERDVEAVVRVGGRLIVSPNTDARVIRMTRALELVSIPGAVTPTECLAALDAGADALKLFPGELVPPPALRGLRTVVPDGTMFIPTGGITHDALKAYKAAGASGFGVATGFYTRGLTADQVHARALAYMKAWDALP